MKLLFESSIGEAGVKIHYKLHEFKLFPGKYKAELLDSPHKQLTEVIFWKEKGHWKTVPPSKHARDIAESIALEIANRKKWQCGNKLRLLFFILICLKILCPTSLSKFFE